MARRIEELPLFRRLDRFSCAVIAILDRPAVRRNRKLWDQLADANDSAVANFAEGFEQGSDAGFVTYLIHSKASLAETIRRLKQFERRRCLTRDELTPLEAEAEEIQRMLGGFIKYLSASNFKRRGTHRGLNGSTAPRIQRIQRISGLRDSRIRD
jgi:four helix bundle protein